jgi:pentatricopeptide repeat protein
MMMWHAPGQVYTALIAACSREILEAPLGNRRLQLVLLERAQGVLAEMQAAKQHPDAILWNALITAAGRAGQLQRAFHTLEDMQVGLAHACMRCSLAEVPCSSATTLSWQCSFSVSSMLS